MKYLLSFIAICLLMSLELQAADSHQVIDFSGQTNAQATLFSTKSHTEYTYERVWRTCSRQVADGYETYCNKSLSDMQNKRRICERVNDRTVCHDDGGSDGGNSGGSDNGGSDHSTSCYTRQTYRTEYYDCEEVIAHPYSVFDYNTNAVVALHFAPWPNDNGDAKAKIEVSLDDVGQLHASANAAQTLVYGNWSDEVRGGSASEKEVSANLNINFRPAKQVFKVLESKINDLKIVDDKITFTLPKGQDIRDYQIALKAKRVRWFLLKDVLIINRALTWQEYSVEEKGDKWLITVDAKLEEKLRRGKKYKVDLAVTLAPEVYHNLLNAGQIPKSTARAEIKQKLK